MHDEGEASTSDEYESRQQGGTKTIESDSDEEEAQEASVSVERRTSISRQDAMVHPMQHAHAQAASQQADGMSRLIMQNQVPLAAAAPPPSQRHFSQQGLQIVAPTEDCMRFYTEESNNSCT